MSESYKGPIEFRNWLGESKWQPALANGQRLFHAEDFVGRWKVWDLAGGRPVLVSRRRALVIASREARHRERHRANRYCEVSR